MQIVKFLANLIISLKIIINTKNIYLFINQPFCTSSVAYEFSLFLIIFKIKNDIYKRKENSIFQPLQLSYREASKNIYYIFFFL